MSLSIKPLDEPKPKRKYTKRAKATPDTPPPPPPEPQNEAEKLLAQETALPAVQTESDDPPHFDRVAAASNATLALAKRELAKRHLLHFIKRYRPQYEAGWVHEDICRRLERFMRQVEAKQSPRLLLMMPYRHGKSEIASRHFAPWVLGHHPNWEIIAASNAQSLATSFSRYIRDIIRDPSYQTVFSATRLDPSSQSVENWNTTKGGGYLAAGIGTAIIGRGAHVLVIDDPVRDAEAADSQVQRDNTWEWYLTTAHSRLSPGGGVLGIMTCLTGETPILLADGSLKRMDCLTTSDRVATFANGALSSAPVVKFMSNGRDSVWKITTSSGKIVRANQSHPFLTITPAGELAWTRTNALTTAHRIVALKGSGGSTKASSAPPKVAISRPSAEASAPATTTRSAGLMAIVASATRRISAVLRALSTATASLCRSMTPCGTLRVVAAPYVASPVFQPIVPVIGRTVWQSTTVTPLEKSEGSSATTATQPSDTLSLNQWHSLPPHTSDFTLDEIVSIEADGVEEVFDISVPDTHNFIAGGLVVHNCWNDDDWGGRVIQAAQAGGEPFEIVRYPAINDQGDEFILEDDSIVQIDTTLTPPPDGARLTRLRNSPLHPERYTLEMLLQKKANYYALGQQRWWAAGYQQNPIPDEGLFFTRSQFRFYGSLPQRRAMHIYQAWDFAISEGKDRDYTVGVTIGQDADDNRYVIDVRRFRSGDSIHIVNTILDYWSEYDADLVGFEDGQIWKAMEAFFSRECEKRRAYPSFEILKPLTDKLVRAQPLRGLMQAGKMYFDEQAPWFNDMRSEFLRFPAGTHDDTVDATAWCVRLSLLHRAPTPIDTTPKMRSWRDKLTMGSSLDPSHMAA